MATKDGGREGEGICTTAGSHENQEEEYKKKMEDLREAGEARNQEYRELIVLILQEIGGSALSQFLKTQPHDDENSILFFWKDELESAVRTLASTRQTGRVKERYWKRLQAKSKDNQRLLFALRQAEERAYITAGTIMENNLELPSEEHTEEMKERDITPDRSEGEEEIRVITRSMPPGAPTIDDDRRKSKVRFSLPTPVSTDRHQDVPSVDRNPAVPNSSPSKPPRSIEVQTDLSLAPTALTPVFTNQKLRKGEDPIGIMLTNQVSVVPHTTNPTPESTPGKGTPGQTSLTYQKRKSPQTKTLDSGKSTLVERRREPGAKQSSQEPQVVTGGEGDRAGEASTTKPGGRPPRYRRHSGGTSHPLPGAADDLVDQLYDLGRPEDQPAPTPPGPVQVFEAKYKRWDLLPGALAHMNQYTSIPLDNKDMNFPLPMEHPDNFIAWVRAAADPETFGSPFNPTSISSMPLFVDIREEDFYELSKVAELAVSCRGSARRQRPSAFSTETLHVTTADKYLEEERKKGVEVYLPFWPRPEFTQLMVGTMMKAVKSLMKHGPKSYSVEQLYKRDLAIFAMVLAMKNKVDLGTPLTDEVFTQLWVTGLGIGDNANAFRGFLVEAFLRQDIDLVNPHGVTVITGNCIQKFAILYHAHLLKEILDNIKEPADTFPPKVKRQRRRGEESESDDEPNDPNDDSFEYLDELEGQALGQAMARGKEKVKTVSLEFPRLNKIIQLRIKDFAMLTANALKVDQKFIQRADRVPHVPACIDLLTRFNGEYPTYMCLAWLALGRSPPTPRSVPACDLVQSPFKPPMHVVLEYVLKLPVEGEITRRERIAHECYGKAPFQFPVMAIPLTSPA
ncbi:hypothetical protein R1sor_008834 [Riccia sorocarpa]|uniref:Uncharacterized protein n=1 Tax=Riccia sorocarpa TaxID=122646 RepID=A0ABD3H7B8_9MARC